MFPDFMFSLKRRSNLIGFGVGLWLSVFTVFWILQAQNPKLEPDEWALFLPESVGRGEVLVFCGNCHDHSYILKTRKTTAAWISTAQEMLDRTGLGLSEDAQIIGSYLGEHFGPQSSHLNLPLLINEASKADLGAFFGIPDEVAARIVATREELDGFSDFQAFKANCASFVEKPLDAYQTFLVFKGLPESESPETEADWAARLPEGEGRGDTAVYCALCHSLSKVVSVRRSPEEWSAIVGKMVGEEGAPISPEVAERILNYVSRNLAPLNEP